MKKKVDHLQELASEYYIRELSKEEVKRLDEAIRADEPGIREAFTSAAKQEWAMHHVHHMDDHRIIHFEPSRKRMTRLRAIAAGITLLFSAGSLFLLHQYRAPHSISVASVSECYTLMGEAVTAVNNGRIRKIKKGSVLHSSDRLVVPRGCRLSFNYLNDDTKIQLADRTEIKVADRHGAKHIRLLNGKLTANVDKQPEGKPLRVITHDAEAVVLGTSFEMFSGEKTRLAVTSGRVRFDSASERLSHEVPAGSMIDSGSWNRRTFEIKTLTPIKEATANLKDRLQHIGVDSARNYVGLLRFDLSSLQNRIYEAYLALRVSKTGSDHQSEGKVTLYRIEDDENGKIKRTAISHYEGRVCTGMDLVFDIAPQDLTGGVDSLLIEMDGEGNEFWFSSSKGERPPQLLLKTATRQN